MYLGGLYTYFKMTHGAYNIKLTICYISSYQMNYQKKNNSIFFENLLFCAIKISLVFLQTHTFAWLPRCSYVTCKLQRKTPVLSFSYHVSWKSVKLCRYAHKDFSLLNPYFFFSMEHTFRLWRMYRTFGRTLLYLFNKCTAYVNIEQYCKKQIMLIYIVH